MVRSRFPESPPSFVGGGSRRHGSGASGAYGWHGPSNPALLGTSVGLKDIHSKGHASRLMPDQLAVSATIVEACPDRMIDKLLAQIGFARLSVRL